MFRIWPFMRMDNRQAEKYLEENAANGYHFRCRGLGEFTVHFEKSEPKNVKYCISSFTWKENEEFESYKTMAEDSGWNLVEKQKGNSIFVSDEGKTPTPLYTDWHDEYELTKKSVWRIMDSGYEIFLISMACITSFLRENFDIDYAWKMIIASLVVFFVVSLIRSVWYMFKAASALQRDLPMSDREHDIGKTLNYVRAVVGCIVAWIGMIVATYIIITKLIPKIISLYLAGNVIVWGITISLITFASILTLAVLFHEKNRKIEKLLEILLIAVFLIFMVFLLVGCIETVSIVG